MMIKKLSFTLFTALVFLSFTSSAQLKSLSFDEVFNKPAKDILNWETTYTEYKDTKYPKPIVDYKKQKDLALKMLGAAFK